MADTNSNPKLNDPWLLAMWPGMGQVAAGAGAYLIDKLKPRPAGAVPERRYFPIDHVDVRNGIARIGSLPRGLFFVWRDPERRHDLILFLGEAQPPARGYDLCRRIMEFAATQGVQRVVTFAAMATQLHPSAEPRVHGAVTAPELLGELRELGVELLAQGQIGGLNGTMLAAAAERGVPAACLLGELPFFAAGVPNPRSSLAVLDVFRRMFGLPVDLSDLTRHAEAVEEQLTAMLEQLKDRAETQGLTLPELERGDEESTISFESGPAAEAPEPAEKRLDLTSRRHIEQLFDTAERDRTRAMELKAELDRLGAFDLYEDRFLDLFRKAG